MPTARIKNYLVTLSCSIHVDVNMGNMEREKGTRQTSASPTQKNASMIPSWLTTRTDYYLGALISQMIGNNRQPTHFIQDKFKLEGAWSSCSHLNSTLWSTTYSMYKAQPTSVR